jgi:hypothetical protein
MARTLITVQEVSRDGISASYVSFDQANGMEFDCTGREHVHIKNTNASGRTLTIDTPGTIDGQAVANRTVAIPGTTGDKKIGPFPPALYAQANGRVYLDIDVGTNVTIGVFRV